MSSYLARLPELRNRKDLLQLWNGAKIAQLICMGFEILIVILGFIQDGLSSLLFAILILGVFFSIDSSSYRRLQRLDSTATGVSGASFIGFVLIFLPAACVGTFGAQFEGSNGQSLFEVGQINIFVTLLFVLPKIVMLYCSRLLFNALEKLTPK